MALNATIAKACGDKTIWYRLALHAIKHIPLDAWQCQPSELPNLSFKTNTKQSMSIHGTGQL